MKSASVWHRRLSWIVCVGLVSGCGRAPDNQAMTRPAAETSASSASAAASGPEAGKPTEAGLSSASPELAQSPAVPAPKTTASTTPEASTAGLAATDTARPAEPVPMATARAVIEKVNLNQLPKLQPVQELQISPTYVYYSAKATLADASKFYDKVFQERGWMPTEHLVTSTDQYIDRLVANEGYYLRLTMSMGGTPEELSITLSSLGNFDVRTLPKTKDVQLDESTAVMAGYKTSLSLAEAAEELNRKLIDDGWQVVVDKYTPAMDVPHYRSLHFRKQAIRVNVGLVQDPAKPNDKASVFYHAESVIPIDIPTLDHREPVQLDAMANQSAVAWKGDRPGMVQLLEKHGQPLGWNFINKADYLAEESTVLFIQPQPAESYGEISLGLAARYVESEGKYWISLERSPLPKPKSTIQKDSDQVAAEKKEPAADAAVAKPSVELPPGAAEAQAAADNLLKQELSKALGNLGTTPTDIKALQEKAAAAKAEIEKLEEEANK